MTTRQRIDLHQEIESAIDRVWAQCLKDQAESKSGEGWRGRAMYFTAGDVEEEVRREARRRMGSWRVRIQGLRGMPLLSHCRDVLFAQMREGKWEAHNHGRGHISGMRFRAPGTGLSESEKRTTSIPREEKARRKHIVHLAREEDGKAACGVDDRKKKGFSYGRHRFRFSPTKDKDRVTCKKCRKLIEEGSDAPQ